MRARGTRPLVFFGEPKSARDHAVEHGRGQAAGLRILLAHVVAAEQRIGADPYLGPVAEAGTRPGAIEPFLLQMAQARSPSDASQGQKDARLPERAELAIEESRARRDF